MSIKYLTVAITTFNVIAKDKSGAINPAFTNGFSLNSL